MINVSRGMDGIFSSTKRDPGGIGSFIDGVGGNVVDGLMSCTESLGFESSDERRVDDRSMDSIDEFLCSSRKERPIIYSKLRQRLVVNKEVKKFPPPLSSLTQDGRPTFFLRPVRSDGRLKLTEVKICRPEILRADRTDGRLRLHLIRDEVEDIPEEDDEEENEMEANKEEIEKEKIEEEEEEEIEGVEEWQLPASGGGGDGFRRCHEQVSHHPHHHGNHHQHVWRHHFVTIR